MQTSLQNQFDLCERQRTDLQRRVLALSDTQRDWRPTPQMWSIRQIVQHLVLCDETVGRAKAVGEIKNEPWIFRLVPRAWRRAMVLRALNRDVILPLPSSDADPCEDVPLSDLLTRWETARREMRAVLETLRGSEPRYAHPVLGPLNATQMLELEAVHTAYHTRQLAALQGNAGFPPNIAA